MRVLILLSKIDQTGMTTNVYDLCGGLKELGHDVILAVGADFHDDKKVAWRFSEFENLGIVIKTFKTLHHGNGIMSKMYAAFQAMWILLTVRCDVIHVESPYLSFLPWLLRKKFTSTFHVCDLVPCFYYKNASHLIAISRETKAYAMEKFGYKEQDVTIVHHGVSPRFAVLPTERQRNELRAKFQIPHSKVVIGLVGSIEPRKGHDILLNAIRNLSDNEIDNLHVVFCGSYKSGNTGWLDRQIRGTLGYSKITHIEYTDPKGVYDVCDIVVLPSRLEGFPLTAIEGMLSGCCVVRSDTQGASEQIVNGETGYIFENENVGQLTEILHELLADAGKRGKLALAGREYALEHFIARRMAENTVKVYEKVINEY